MQDFRTQLRQTDAHRLAPIGEACALLSALSSLIFVFFTELRPVQGEGISLIGLFGQSSQPLGALGAVAAALSLGAACILFALTVLRYVRFLRGKSKKDSLYFSYAVYFSYLAGIMLFCACAADGTYRLSPVSAAGIGTGGALLLASAALFLIAKGRTPHTPHAFLRALAGVLTLAVFALFSSGAVTDGDRLGLLRLAAAGLSPEKSALACAAFAFETAFAACAVLLLERLFGGIAQRPKPVFLRAALTALFAAAAALCELFLLEPAAGTAALSAALVPAVILLLVLLLLAALIPDAFPSRRDNR